MLDNCPGRGRTGSDWKSAGRSTNVRWGLEIIQEKEGFNGGHSVETIITRTIVHETAVSGNISFGTIGHFELPFFC